MKRRITTFLLAAILCLTLLPAAALAAGPGELPAYYNSNDLGYVTPVKHQGYGDCWAHAAISCIETYMIMHGITDPATGKPAEAATLDLSEYHLAWFSFTDAYDAMGMLTGDRTVLLDTSDFNDIYLNRGNPPEAAAFTLMRWEGPAGENVPALAYSNISYDGLDKSFAYQYDAAHVTDYVVIPASKTEEVKTAIMEYGSCIMPIRENESYLNSNGAYFCPEELGIYCSHAVTVVGWDDNYSRLNFKEDTRPVRDGAWIVKNSRDTDHGDGGYYYYSYEDNSVLSAQFCFFRVSPLDEFDHNYQYDGTGNVIGGGYHSVFFGGSTAANVFTANGTERLDAVAVSTGTEDLPYTLRIYTNLTDPAVPSSGALAAEQTGVLVYSGYQTIRLERPVPLTPGETFAVAFQLNCPETDVGVVNLDYSVIPASVPDIQWIHLPRSTSFYQKPGDSGWMPAMGGEGNFRIKAYTNDYVPTEERMSAELVCGSADSVALTPAGGAPLRSAVLMQGQLPPGMSLRLENGTARLEGVPTTPGTYTPQLGLVTTPGQVIWLPMQLLVTSDTVTEQRRSVSLELGESASFPVCETTEAIRSVQAVSGRLPGAELTLNEAGAPILTVRPTVTGQWTLVYELTLNSGTVLRQALDVQVFDPAGEFPFTDVPETEWYYNDVLLAYRTGLVNGKTATTYLPDDMMTCAEAVKLAACMHQKYTTGTVTLANGTPWYQSYADYARANGIISRDYDWDAPISRADYAAIFAHALPETAFEAKNSIAYDAIPDVKSSHPQAAEIYKLYRAGILAGNDSLGTFLPDSMIKRSEVAAILTRMMDTAARKSLTL
ncbi:MAG: S-layer homology domain-containing protein [Oscillospiraceae bacterium]|nr:S-layer homology domain-containing protein [Oscillospiraceae bacterium]